MVLAVPIPLGAHIALLLAAFALIAWLEYRHDKAETRLRKKLGACRSSLRAAEILRDRYRRERDGLSIEVGKWRRTLPAESRLTQVRTIDPVEPQEG